MEWFIIFVVTSDHFSSEPLQFEYVFKVALSIIFIFKHTTSI